MKHSNAFIPVCRSVMLAAVAVLSTGMAFAQQTVQWTDSQLVNYVKGMWIAKCVGGTQCGPMEGATFNSSATVSPVTPDDITNCGNDDIYAQIPYIATMTSKMNGANGIFTATTQDYSVPLKNSTIEYWCANLAARNALNSGIAAPYCGGTPLNGVTQTGSGCGPTPACEDISWQFICQWASLAPGLPNVTMKVDSIAAHLVCYASGFAGGLFVSTATCIAPFYTNIVDVIKAARFAVPRQYDIRQNIDTLIWYYDHNPTSTYATAYDWAFGQNGQAKHTITQYFGPSSKDNASCLVIEALWSNNDIQTAILNAARIGYDADCDGGNVAAIFGAMLGFNAMPQQWKDAWNAATQGTGCVFSGIGVSGWNFTRAIDSSIAFCKKAILQAGGAYANGFYTWTTQPVTMYPWFEQVNSNPVFVGARTPVAARQADENLDRLVLKAEMRDGKIRLRFSVPSVVAGRKLKIDLLDIRGRLIEKLAEDIFGAGYHTVNLPLSRTDQRGCGWHIARITVAEKKEQSVTVLSR